MTKTTSDLQTNPVVKLRDTDWLDLEIDDPAWRNICDVETLVARSIMQVIAIEDMALDDVSLTVVLSHDERVAQLNTQWRSKPGPTNVLSFPAPAGEKNETGGRYLGDIILAFGVVEAESRQQGKALETHLCHLVIHGALHLLGYDHQSDEEARHMENLERAVMKSLDLPDPYLPQSAKQEKDVQNR